MKRKNAWLVVRRKSESEEDVPSGPAPAASASFRWARLLLYPVRCWNWKTASITAALRAAAFLLAFGGRGGRSGALVEAAYVIFTSGFFSAIQQGLLDARPRSLGRFGIVAGVPVVSLALDCVVHSLAASPNPTAVTAGMLFFSLVSAAFHLHVMENGAMLVGGRGRSFLADLKAVPGLLVSFIAAPASWLAAVARNRPVDLAEVE